ncbi:MAG: class I SAM-dependent methyltransferase [Myxococcota bacterium]
MANTTLSNMVHGLKFQLRLRERLRPALKFVDTLALPATALSALYLRGLRRVGIRDLARNRELLSQLGVFPLQAHYYEPLTRRQDLRRPMSAPRDLPGLELNEAGQLEWLGRFDVGSELLDIPVRQESPTTFGYENGTFAFADAAYTYAMIRTVKPRRWIEVGSGNSTLVARLAMEKNAVEGHPTQHRCIEPFEMPWLEQLGIEIVRSQVERCPPTLFEELESGDVLFIDSSHVLRPQGDVLFLYQEVLPRLKPGVFVHVHDVFTPRDYPEHWVLERMLMWDEQYLLEAFLTFNSRFEVVGALNHLFHSHFAALSEALPILAQHRDREPMSFWMRVRG